MKRKGASKADTSTTTVVLFVRVKPETKKWLSAEAYRTGHFMGHVLDTAVKALRLKKKYHLEQREMKTLANAKQQYENRLKRYKE